MLANSPSGPSKLRPNSSSQGRERATHAAKAFNAPHCSGREHSASAQLPIYVAAAAGMELAARGRARGARRRAGALPGSSGRGGRPQHPQRPAAAPKWGAGTKVVGAPRPYADRIEFDGGLSPLLCLAGRRVQWEWDDDGLRAPVNRPDFCHRLLRICSRWY